MNSNTNQILTQSKEKKKLLKQQWDTKSNKQKIIYLSLLTQLIK